MKGSSQLSSEQGLMLRLKVSLYFLCPLFSSSTDGLEKQPLSEASASLSKYPLRVYLCVDANALLTQIRVECLHSVR